MITEPTPLAELTHVYTDAELEALDAEAYGAADRKAAERVAAPQPLQMALPPGTVCAWFAGCQNDATHIEAHPILTGVPACDRCPQIGR